MTAHHDEQADDIADRLDAIAEELAELAIETLRAALADRTTSGRPASEKRITQARRAVEKAAHVLRGMQTGSEELD
ncbi:MAG: hypothetical protein AB7Q42_07505 [Acidimicrobiia bacterium]